MTTREPTTRVLHLLPDFDLGGGQVVLLRMNNALSGPVWEHIVVAFGGGPMLDVYRSDGIRCDVIGDGTAKSWPAAVIRLRRLIGREQIDVMLSMNTPLDRTMAQIGAAATGRPVVVWFMSVAIPLIRFPPPARRVLAFFKRLVLYPFNYLSIRRVAGLAVNSEAVARSFADHLHIPVDRFVTVAPGLPDSAFGPALDAERARALRSELGLRGGHPVLLNVGMLIPLKGQLQLIEMLELLADDLPDAQLLLAGDGPDRPMLEARILASAVGGRVHLLGHRQDVPELLRISDALLSASRSEGFGLSLLEAMAASLPVIGVRTPAFLEFLDEGITAELVDAQDAAQLADAVRRVFSDPTRAAEMGARGRQRALEYRTSVRAEALGDFLQNALRPGASGR
jgi:glycosyltransferase involved in cell wall biosynthesis